MQHFPGDRELTEPLACIRTLTALKNEIYILNVL